LQVGMRSGLPNRRNGMFGEGGQMSVSRDG